MMLEDAAPGGEITGPSILIYGQDLTLLETRSWVFQRNGFDVYCALRIEDAQQTLRARSSDLFLMCHTIPANEHQSTVNAIQAIQPEIPIMLITTATQSTPEGNWHTVDALAGTQAMLLVARGALRIV